MSRYLSLKETGESYKEKLFLYIQPAVYKMFGKKF